ncbi:MULTISPECIES: phosphodiester glycosidase family protein [Streptomyces]|uniref:phosphodiester glycosidase family protein n=1 Tax=Streptomyces TaxID=1883 RepID=UPI0022490A4B|nr:phosphodiester glycosidase family protein [Streptomyces sp. JHD 1]MCX2968979.1 phosphodiester glycosidase family protein [Streptomyces sp. JHD 1]
MTALRGLLLTLATSLLLTATAAPARPAPPAHPAPPASAPEAGPGPRAPSGSSSGDRRSLPVAPGVTLTSWDEPDAVAPLRAGALTVDLAAGARVDYLAPASVAERRTVSELAAAHAPGAGRRTVAALNGDFFDLGGTGAPLGPGLRDGVLRHSGSRGHTRAVGFGPRSGGRVLDLLLAGTVHLPHGAELPLGGYDAADVPEDGIGAYTPRWGTADRALTVDGAQRTAEVAVADGAVVSVRAAPGRGAVPEGTTVLVGRGAGARALAALAPGDPVRLTYGPRTGDGGPLPRTAVGGREPLVVDGAPRDWTGAPNDRAAPRTAVGFSADGTRLFVLTVDGRQAASRGVTLTRLGRMLHGLGAHHALNLDGGGSSTLLAGAPGAAAPEVVNDPSDGAERPVPNGLAVTVPLGSGRPAGFHVRPLVERTGARPERVFPGLTRRLAATAHDETYGPAHAVPRWRVDRPDRGAVDAGGTVRALRPGPLTVTAWAGRARGGTRLEVLTGLARLRATSGRVGLAAAGDSAAFGLVGSDAGGREAPVEPGDVRLSYDRELFDVTADPARGTLTVTARADAGSGRVTAEVAGRRAVVEVGIGLTDVPVADFSDADRWAFSAARAEGALSADPAGRKGLGLRLRYDFGRSTRTRAAYATPPAPLPVPGRPRAFTLWLRGDGHGAWPSLRVTDAAGVGHVLRGPHVTWHGWRRISFPVPAGLAHPVTVERLYLAETRATARYAGEVVLDELTARVPPEPRAPRVG